MVALQAIRTAAVQAVEVTLISWVLTSTAFVCLALHQRYRNRWVKVIVYELHLGRLDQLGLIIQAGPSELLKIFYQISKLFEFDQSL